MTGSADSTTIAWDTISGQKLLTLPAHEVGVRDIALSPDGYLIATGGFDGTAKVWDAQTGELVFTLVGHNAGLPDIAYSPDGALIATGSGDGTAILWDAATDSKLRTLIGHSAQIQSVAFSPDGKLLATGSEDNTAKIWEVATGQKLLTLPGSQGAVRGVAFSPTDGGAHLVVSSGDGIARVFLLRLDDLLALAQSRVTRTLPVKVCKNYLHVDQCPVALGAPLCSCFHNRHPKLHRPRMSVLHSQFKDN